jgi:HPt (histidine-containing phosphotransfer) domain-containing protein
MTRRLPPLVTLTSVVTTAKILLVAEDALRAAKFRAILEEQGHDVFHAASITEASEALEIQKFQFVLRDSAPGRALNGPAFGRFHELLQGRDRPLLVVIREDVAAAKPFYLANGEPGVDAVIEGRFSSVRLWELLDGLLHEGISRSSPSAPPLPSGVLSVFERDQFERQMNHDRRLMAEIIQLFVTETTHQIAALESALDAGSEVQAKRLAHTLKGSFGAVYAHRAGALAREMEAAVAGDLSSARSLMPRLKLANAEVQSELQQLLVE